MDGWPRQPARGADIKRMCAEEKAFPFQDLAHDIRAWAEPLIEAAADDEAEELAHTLETYS